MSRPLEHVANEVDYSTELVPVAWQLSLEAPGDERWWLVRASIWAANEHNPRKEIVVAPDVPGYLRQIELGREAARRLR